MLKLFLSVVCSIVVMQIGRILLLGVSQYQLPNTPAIEDDLRRNTILTIIFAQIIILGSLIGFIHSKYLGIGMFIFSILMATSPSTYGIVPDKRIISKIYLIYGAVLTVILLNL